MWKPGNLVQIKERVPIEGGSLVLSTTCRVINNSSNKHRCLNCPMQQVYCDIETCEENLPMACTLKKVHMVSDRSDA